MDHIVISYKNWRGEVADRRIVPPNGKSTFEVYFASNSWHPDLQWLFDALDLDRGAIRTFAMTGIKSWKQATGFSKVAPMEFERGSGA